jgi:hypothetical protein
MKKENLNKWQIELNFKLNEMMTQSTFDEISPQRKKKQILNQKKKNENKNEITTSAKGTSDPNCSPFDVDINYRKKIA